MLLSLLLFVSVAVYAQEFPYISYMGRNFSNNSLVDLTLVESFINSSVECHTDLSTCCSMDQGIHRGDWYSPNGTRLPLSLAAERIDLLLTDAPLQYGLYRCDVATSDVHDGGDTLVKDTIYVGLYDGGGKPHRLYLL